MTHNVRLVDGTKPAMAERVMCGSCFCNILKTEMNENGMEHSPEPVEVPFEVDDVT